MLWQLDPCLPLTLCNSLSSHLLPAVTCRDDLVKIGDHSLASSKAIDARDLSMLLAMCFTAGRGDDVRERRLCELTPPLQRTCIGETQLAIFSRQVPKQGVCFTSR
jgi:hypothetical protein